jgi:hypothetical protein
MKMRNFQARLFEGRGSVKTATAVMRGIIASNNIPPKSLPACPRMPVLDGGHK